LRQKASWAGLNCHTRQQGDAKDFQTLDVNIAWNLSVGETEDYGGKDLEKT